MAQDNYALWLLKNALRDEIQFKQQALQVLEGNEPMHVSMRTAFSESLKLADERLPDLLDAINRIENKHKP